MTTNLGALPSNVPLKTGVSQKRIPAAGAAVVWPPAENYLLPGSGEPGEVGPIIRPHRFWWCVGASIINHCNTGWQRYDYQLRLVVNSVYGNDLNGINYFQKANSNENHGGSWLMSSIEARWYCEANTTYHCYLLSKSSSPNCYYYQHPEHYTLWSYTVGEDVY